MLTEPLYGVKLLHSTFQMEPYGSNRPVRMVTGCRQAAPFHPSNGGKSHADCSILPSYGPYCRHSAKCLLYVGGLDYTATFTIQQQPADIHPSNGGKSHADCSILPSYGPYCRHSAKCLVYVGGLDYTATFTIQQPWQITRRLLHSAIVWSILPAFGQMFVVCRRAGLHGEHCCMSAGWTTRRTVVCRRAGLHGGNIYHTAATCRGKSHADCSILPSYGPYCRHSAKCTIRQHLTESADIQPMAVMRPPLSRHTTPFGSIRLQFERC
jgi:hypothetical protein